MRTIDIETIPGLVKAEKLSLKDATYAIWQYLYERPFYYGAKQVEEDVKSDFLLYIHPKFAETIKSFVSAKSSFQTYLSTYLQKRFKSWLRKIEENSVCEDILIQTKKEDYEDCIEHYPDELDRITTSFDTAFETTESQQIVKKSKKRKKAEITALILLLRACNETDDCIIKKIADYTNTPMDTLLEMIQHLKETVAKKKDKIGKLVQKRDNAYFFHRKYSAMLKKPSLRESRRKSILRLYENHTSRWLKYNELLASRKLCTPSSEEIAKELHISPRLVYYCITHALKENAIHWNADE